MTQQKEVTGHLPFISKMTTNANRRSSSIVSLWPTKTKVLGDSAANHVVTKKKLIHSNQQSDFNFLGITCCVVLLKSLFYKLFFFNFLLDFQNCVTVPPQSLFSEFQLPFLFILHQFGDQV